MEIDEKQIFSIIQKAKESGSVRIGVNEVTKAIERGQAKLVASANDVSPAEIIAHLPGLCKEMKMPYAQIGTKSDLGAIIAIKSTSTIAVIDAGSAKKELETLTKELMAPPKEAAPVKEAKTEAPVKEEAKAEVPVKEEVKVEAPAKKVEAKVETPAKKEGKKE